MEPQSFDLWTSRLQGERSTIEPPSQTYSNWFTFSYFIVVLLARLILHVIIVSLQTVVVLQSLFVD